MRSWKALNSVVFNCSESSFIAIFNNNLAINPKIGARLVGTHFSQLTMLGLVISSNELCFLTARAKSAILILSACSRGTRFCTKKQILKIKWWCGETCLSSQQCQTGSRIKHASTNTNNFPSLNLDKTRVKLFTNFTSIPFDYLLIVVVILALLPMGK